MPKPLKEVGRSLGLGMYINMHFVSVQMEVENWLEFSEVSNNWRFEKSG